MERSTRIGITCNYYGIYFGFNPTKLTKYFAGFQARSADVLAFGEAVDEGADGLDVGIPPATGAALGMGNIVTEAGGFAAYGALC